MKRIVSFMVAVLTGVSVMAVNPDVYKSVELVNHYAVATSSHILTLGTFIGAENYEWYLCYASTDDNFTGNDYTLTSVVFLGGDADMQKNLRLIARTVMYGEQNELTTGAVVKSYRKFNRDWIEISGYNTDSRVVALWSAFIIKDTLVQLLGKAKNLIL